MQLWMEFCESLNLTHFDVCDVFVLRVLWHSMMSAQLWRNYVVVKCVHIMCILLQFLFFVNRCPKNNKGNVPL